MLIIKNRDFTISVFCTNLRKIIEETKIIVDNNFI